jgi:hypothetical protein
MDERQPISGVVCFMGISLRGGHLHALRIASMLLLATGCSGGSGSKVLSAPQTPSHKVTASAVVTVHRGSRPQKQPFGLLSRGGKLTSFSEALHANLQTDDDFDRFVDPQVIGDDRKLAIRLLRMMPANLRGDFIYYDGKRLLSNRPELTHGIRFSNSIQPMPTRSPDSQSPRATLSYPPTTGTGGPWIRHYSAQGVNAAVGYATFPCDSQLLGNDSGFMYFNSYTASSSGSVMDAGLWIHPGNSATPFINRGSYGGYLYAGWTDENYTWSCGQHVGMMYGTQYGTGISVLMIGYPDFDPTVYALPPASSTWHHSAWNFFQTPSPLTSGTGIWQGTPSPCMGCSVAKMFTISPGNTPGDTSCFGLCGTYPDARWDQVVMGELTQPCGQTPNVSATCTVTYPTDNSWYGDVNAGGSALALYTTNSPNTALEGLKMGASGVTPFSAAFSTLQPLPAATCDDIRTWMLNNTAGAAFSGTEPMTGEVVSFPPDGVATYQYSSFQQTPDGLGGYQADLYTYWTVGGTTVTGDDYWVDVQGVDRYGCS